MAVILSLYMHSYEETETYYATGTTDRRAKWL